MSYRLYSPENSFVQFSETGEIASCGFAPLTLCLPVYYEDDVAFQVIVEGDTEEETDLLCGAYGIKPTFGLTSNGQDFDLEFNLFPEVFRMDSKHLLYQWPHGFPGFQYSYNIGDCFSVLIELNELLFSSNCFYRTGGICWTTKLEYTNNDNFAGFNYCSGGTIPSPGGIDCQQEFHTFNNIPILNIPYTASLKAKYGNVPSVQVWIRDVNGELVDMGIRVALDDYPPTELRFDFGGNASGVIRISN